MLQPPIIEHAINAAPVIPVIVIDDASIAKPLGEALVAGGLPVLEVTLRTEAALDAVREMGQIEGAITGVGTVLTESQASASVQAGAKFGVSPGATDMVLQGCSDQNLPLLPAASTVSEAMRLLERGYSFQKFFPAEAAGGAPFLKSLASVLPHVTFCPTGGISPKNAMDYLSLPNVKCVGGSWVVPKDLVAKRDWPGITALAQKAATLTNP